METKKEFRHLVRIANSDMKGEQQLAYGLRNVKGVGYQFANSVCIIANIDKSKKVGYLDDQEIEKLNDILMNPLKYGMPVWMLNRRKDMEDGTSKHLLISDLKFQVENDIKRMKRIRNYKGVRHTMGQPVRGQKTKSHFRKNKGKVQGVVKRADAKPGKV